MNAGQEAFMGFIMGNIQDGKKDEAKALLEESFTKQDDGSFNPAYLASIVPKLAATLKPECIDELKSAASKFAASGMVGDAVNKLAGGAAGGTINKLAGGAMGSLFGGDKK